MHCTASSEATGNNIQRSSVLVLRTNSCFCTPELYPEESKYHKSECGALLHGDGGSYWNTFLLSFFVCPKQQ